ncbi:hypothetical protein KSP40_PGU015322 [Platanthera guangdongensis]|uniref:Uncharacterized protein n=1 Tax=Platanthera guangdongensis TaxID=2320717 RepID=A0ABR2M371_9ASPA
MSPTIAPLWDDDEWEVCNDDGFIYKRRRLALPEGPSPTDIEVELRRQKCARKWRCLRAIHDKYQREIDQWEGLSASLTRLPSPPTSTSNVGPSSMDSAPPSPLSLPMVNDLLSTVNLVRNEGKSSGLKHQNDVLKFIGGGSKSRANKFSP